MPTGQLVNLPAGAPLRPTGQPFNRSTNRSVICHPFSPCPASGGRWQPRVAGGGCSALPHRLSHLSSVIDSVIHSVIHSFRVAGGSSGWPVAALFHSALHSVLNAALHSVLRDQFSPPPLRVAGGSPGWQGAGDGLFHSALHSVLCHPFSPTRGS
jgi:hypothetical protein